MSRPFVSLITLDDLDRALASSQIQPIVLFKHSLSCGTSAMAYEDMEGLLADDGVTASIYVIPVQTARAVSSAIAERFGVRHESPQVLIVHQGTVVWHGSHFRVTAANVRARLEAQAAAV